MWIFSICAGDRPLQAWTSRIKNMSRTEAVNIGAQMKIISLTSSLNWDLGSGPLGDNSSPSSDFAWFSFAPGPASDPFSVLHQIEYSWSIFAKWSDWLFTEPISIEITSVTKSLPWLKITKQMSEVFLDIFVRKHLKRQTYGTLHLGWKPWLEMWLARLSSRAENKHLIGSGASPYSQLVSVIF